VSLLTSVLTVVLLQSSEDAVTVMYSIAMYNWQVWLAIVNAI